MFVLRQASTKVKHDQEIRLVCESRSFFLSPKVLQYLDDETSVQIQGCPNRNFLSQTSNCLSQNQNLKLWYNFASTF